MKNRKEVERLMSNKTHEFINEAATVRDSRVLLNKYNCYRTYMLAILDCVSNSNVPTLKYGLELLDIAKVTYISYNELLIKGGETNLF